MIKSPKEIAYIKQAATITDQCFTYILNSIKPGVTESEIAHKIESYITRHMGLQLAFPPITAFGKNTSIVHHLKPSRHVKCRKQEIVLLDFGAKFQGYCSDMTRMVFVGKPKKEWKRAYETVLLAQQTVISIITKEKTCSGAAMDIRARTLIAKAGFPPYPHGLGHSLGQKIHEYPKLNRKKDERITPGMAFTIEPGTYIKGEYGIRIEDTVYLSKISLEILTKSPKCIVV